MHEMSIASTILETARAEASRRNARLVKIGIRLGDWSGVDPDALRFSFDVLAADSLETPVTLEIERCPRRNRCRACSHEFTIEDYGIACPACGAPDTRAIGGDELEFAYMEIEEP